MVLLCFAPFSISFIHSIHSPTMCTFTYYVSLAPGHGTDMMILLLLLFIFILQHKETFYLIEQM